MKMIKVLNAKGKEVYTINYMSTKENKSTVLQNKICNIIFTEKDNTHQAWNDMLVKIQIEKQKKPERPITVQIHSLQDLNSRDEKQFNQMLKDLLKYGASLYSVSEDILWNQKYPNGLCKHSGDIDKAMKKLHTDWLKNKALEGIPLNNGEKLHITPCGNGPFEI